MIVFASILGAILATSILALNPSTITSAGAQMYGDQYGYDSNYYQDDNRYGYDNNHPKKSSHGDIQKINCVNSIINVNGVDIIQIPQDGTATAAATANEAGPEGTADAANTQNGNGLADKINFDRNLVNVCVNNNDNEQVKISFQEPEEPLSCEECFNQFLTQQQIDDLLSECCDVANLAEFCLAGEQGTVIINRVEFTEQLIDVGLTLDDSNNLIECLESAGNFVFT
jgi:hypothetical protein